MTVKEFINLSEEEQWEWLWDNEIPYPLWGGSIESLADLAFRLRDEVVKGTHKKGGKEVNYEISNRYLWSDAKRLVYRKCLAERYNNLSQHGEGAVWNWYAKPTHWIAAALKAKGVLK